MAIYKNRLKEAILINSQNMILWRTNGNCAKKSLRIRSTVKVSWVRRCSRNAVLLVPIKIASEAVLMSRHNIGLYREVGKIIPKLLSNIHLN